MLDLVLVGAGGFAREVYHWARSAFDPDTHRLKGFLSNRPDDLAGRDFDVPLLGDPAAYAVRPADRFLLAVGDPSIKRALGQGLASRGARFATLVHPTAIVAPTARLGEGVVLCPFATVSDAVELGEHVMLNFYASAGHDARIGRYATLSPYATVNGFAVLGEEVFLGSHATVTARRNVGDGARVGANVAVHADVPPRTLVYGPKAKLASIFGD